jgi:hypothetical protein
VNWLLAVLQAMHWFNPLVWIAFRRLQLDRELARDAATLTHLARGDRSRYGETLLQLSQPARRRIHVAGALGVVDDHAQLRSRILMIAHAALPGRRQTTLAAMLLLLLGLLAFSKPAFVGNSPSLPAPASRTVSALGALVANLPAALDAPIEAAATTSHLTGTPAAGRAARSAARTIPALSPASALTADPTAVSLLAAAADPELAITMAQLEAATSAEPQPETATTSATPRSEIYRDWNAILALHRKAIEARDPTVNAITEWNRQAVECQIPRDRRSAEDHMRAHCKPLYQVVYSGQFADFWLDCRSFIRNYNNLAIRFTRTDAAQFTDRVAVANELHATYGTLSEFCNTRVYRAKYPQLSRLAALGDFSPPATDNSFWWSPQYVGTAVPYTSGF